MTDKDLLPADESADGARVSLPEGNVTFLYSKVQGMGKLAQRDSKLLDESVAKYRDLLNEHIKSNSGFLIQYSVNSSLAVFKEARSAVEAAAAIVRESSSALTTGIKSGIHTGPAVLKDGSYDAYLTIARAHRVMTVSQPGQILVSATSAEALGEAGFELQDLGEHKLKDLLTPIRLYQLIDKGLKTDFPRLMTAAEAASNLPAQLSSFIGREELTEEVVSAVRANRFVTLTGFGGVGKTRLSIRAGSELLGSFRHGVWFIELASLDSQSQIIRKVAAVLNIKEDGESDLMAAVTSAIRDKEMLLIFDNCEHLLGECSGVIERILRSAGSVKALATSRESFNIHGELSFKVPPLELPGSGDSSSILKNESVKLFVERARGLNSSFRLKENQAETVAGICSRLEGIPLAIELAAVKTSSMPLEKILEKLSQRLRLLTGGKRSALLRHQTISDMIDWSYALMSEKEKTLFTRLSAFENGWTLEAAERICSFNGIDEYEMLDILSALIDKSMITAGGGRNENRYSMLETLKEYARSKISEQEEFDTSSRLLDFCAELIEHKSHDTEFVSLSDLEEEYENIRKAIAWSLKHDKKKNICMARALEWFWDASGMFNEAYRVLSDSINTYENKNDEYFGTAILSMSQFCLNLSRMEEALDHCQTALEIFKSLGISERICESLILIGMCQLQSGDIEAAKKSMTKSLELSDATGDENLRGDALANLSTCDLKSGNLNAARENYLRAEAVFKKIGKTRPLQRVLLNLGAVELYSGRYDEAIAKYEDALSIQEELNDAYAHAATLVNLGNIRLRRKEFGKAKECYTKSMQMSESYGLTDLKIFLRIKTAEIEFELGNTEQAKRSVNELVMDPHLTDDLRRTALLAKISGKQIMKEGRNEDALLCFSYSARLYEDTGFPLPPEQEQELKGCIEHLSGLTGKTSQEIIRSGRAMTFEQFKSRALL